MSNQRAEMTDIIIAKGIAILLVVIGHILSRGTSVGNEWFSVVMGVIYLFHMPFFMMLSGYVFFRIGRVEGLYDRYKDFVGKQFMRLIIPFFAMGLFVLVGKMVAQHVLHVDNVPESLLSGVYGMVWNTSKSPSIFIWYIYVLFVYTAITPLLFKFASGNFIPLFVLGLLMYIADVPQYMYLDKLMPFYVFFVTGGILRQYQDKYLEVIDKYRYIFIGVFCMSFTLYDPTLPEYSHAKFIVGMLSIPAVHGMSRGLVEMGGWIHKLFYTLGQYSYSIYLFNTICIGLTKAVLFKVTHWHGLNFLFFAPILIAAGAIGPMIIVRVYAMKSLIFKKEAP